MVPSSPRNHARFPTIRPPRRLRARCKDRQPEGERPKMVEARSHQARAGVSGATPLPKQADNGDEGTHVAPRPLCGTAGPNDREARRSPVRRARSNAEDGSADPFVGGRRQHQRSETGTRTTAGLPGISGRACSEGLPGGSRRPERVPRECGRCRSTRPVRRSLSRVTHGITANRESHAQARAGVGGAHSSEEAAVMAVDAKGLYFGEATRGERGHPIHREV